MLDSVDTSDMLKPGVYVLSHLGRVVFVGRAKCMLAAIADHRTANGSKSRLPDWFPIRAVQFDAITIHPMPYASTLALADALIQLHRPPANLHTGPAKALPSHTPTGSQAPPTITRRL